MREFARVVVRGGTFDDATARAEIAEAVRDNGLADPQQTARRLFDEAAAELEREQLDWPKRTDYDALQEALAALQRDGLAVLQSTDDHWSAQRELDRRAEAGEPCRGIVWFTAPDVWHAVQHAMLELNLWHADSANATDGDRLLAEVIAVLDEHGIDAHFDEGRIEATLHWHRRRR